MKGGLIAYRLNSLMVGAAGVRGIGLVSSLALWLVSSAELAALVSSVPLRHYATVKLCLRAAVKLGMRRWP